MTTRNASELVIVDSSGWVSYIGGLAKAADYAVYLENPGALLVPTIVLYEVLKKIRTPWEEARADRFVSHALRSQVVSLDADLAQAAVQTSIEYRLAMADAIIYATARSYEAQLVTSDTHFQGLPGVTLI